MAARYPVLNAWLERILTKAAHCVPITCVLGWSLSMSGKPGEERTFLNFPMQANSAELMRLIIVRAGHLPLIGCAHDSFLIEDTIERIDQSVAELHHATCSMASSYAPTASRAATSCAIRTALLMNASAKRECVTGIG
jgi:hypothetical protein